MNEKTCPNCHSNIPADAPGGVCPKCVFAAATDKPPVRPYVTTAIQGNSFRPPSSAELTAKLPDLEVIELIGQGGMGAVYRARQIHLDRIVALKILSPSLGNDPTFTERFAREARTLAKLTHPNIVNVFNSGNIDGMCYLIMEFIDGVNLRDAIRNKSITSQEALQIVPQICEALQFAHDEGVVHRDIKPENILLNKRGQIKIADFGLAKILDRDPIEYSLTGTHQVIGTRNYMAPEQIEKPEKVDHRADIYSLGVVFYELLTGELPIGRFANPSEKASINEGLDDVVLRTLEKEPDRRYQQASEFKTAVESIGPPPKITKPPVKPPQQFQPVPMNPEAKLQAVQTPFTIEDLHGGFAAAYGIARFDDEKLILEFDVRDEVFGSIKSGTKRVELDAADIVKLHFKDGVFVRSVEFSMSSLSVASAVPGSKQGIFKLTFKKKDMDVARQFVDTINSYLHKNPNRVAPRSAPVVQSFNDGAEPLDAQKPDPSLQHPISEEQTKKINGPVIGLFVVGIINVATSIGSAIGWLMDMLKDPREKIFAVSQNISWSPDLSFGDNFSTLISHFVNMVINPFTETEWLPRLVIGFLMIMAVHHLKKFSNQRLVWIGVIAAMIPLYKFFVIGLVFAIWTCVVLSDPEIKALFAKCDSRLDGKSKRCSDRQFRFSLFLAVIAVTFFMSMVFVRYLSYDDPGDSHHLKEPVRAPETVVDQVESSSSSASVSVSVGDGDEDTESSKEQSDDKQSTTTSAEANDKDSDKDSESEKRKEPTKSSDQQNR